MKSLRSQFFICFMLFFICMNPSTADNHRLSLELSRASLPDTIRVIASYLHMNVIVSPTVHGTVSLTLHNALPNDVFETLLTTEGLAEWPQGSVMLIAPQEELIRRQEALHRWQSIALDSQHLYAQFWTLKYARAVEVAKLITGNRGSLLSQRGQLSLDLRTNTLYVRDTAETLSNIRHLITRLDVPVQQIIISARLASVDSDDEQELGVNFSVVAGKNSVNPTHGQYSIAIASLADSSLLDIKLNALENSGRAELISKPSLCTANGQAASIESGEEVPYQEESDSGGTTVVFKKAVLRLEVIPQVLPNGYILLHLQINQDRPSTTLVLGMPTITTRQIVTSVLIKNGATIALGGIYETDDEHNTERLPFLGAIPVLGTLFSNRTTHRSKRELLIFVTPQIINV